MERLTRPRCPGVDSCGQQAGSIDPAQTSRHRTPTVPKKLQRSIAEVRSVCVRPPLSTPPSTGASREVGKPRYVATPRGLRQHWNSSERAVCALMRLRAPVISPVNDVVLAVRVDRHGSMTGHTEDPTSGGTRYRKAQGQWPTRAPLPKHNWLTTIIRRHPHGGTRRTHRERQKRKARPP